MDDQKRGARRINYVSSDCVLVICLILVSSFHAVHGADLYPHDDHTSLLQGESIPPVVLFNLANNLVAANSQFTQVVVNPTGRVEFVPEFDSPFARLYGVNADLRYTTGMDVKYLNTDDVYDVQQIEDTMTAIDPDFNMQWALVFTWKGMAAASPEGAARNSFQIVVTKGLSMGQVAIFNYNQVEWTDGATALGGYRDPYQADHRLPCLGAGVGLTDYTDFGDSVLVNGNTGVPGRYVMGIDHTLPTVCDGFNDPVMTVVQGNVQMEGGRVVTWVGEYLLFRCKMDGRDPSVTKMTFECGPFYSNQTTGDEIYMIALADSFLNGSCSCEVKHQTGYYPKTSYMSVQVQHPPEAAPEMNINNAGTILPNATVYTSTQGDTVNVSCAVLGGEPVVGRVVLDCGDGEQVGQTSDDVEVGLTLAMDAGWDGKSCWCWAEHVTGEYHLRTMFTFFVNYPPPGPPRMTVNGQAIPSTTGSVVTATAGDQIDLRCVVEGGNPVVETVNLYCGFSPFNVTAGTVASLALTLDTGFNQRECICSGVHETLYNSVSTFTFRVRGTCDPGWFRDPAADGVSCLKVIKKVRRSFAKAREYCAWMGGDLATSVYGRTQRRHVTRQIKFLAHLWIGVHDSQRNGTYAYIDGAPLGPRPPFKRGRPHPGNKFCVSIKKGRWFDKKCSTRQFFVCQRPETMPPSSKK